MNQVKAEEKRILGLAPHVYIRHEGDLINVVDLLHKLRLKVLKAGTFDIYSRCRVVADRLRWHKEWQLFDFWVAYLETQGIELLEHKPELVRDELVDLSRAPF